MKTKQDQDQGLKQKGCFEINYYDNQGWLKISRQSLIKILENTYIDPSLIIKEAISEPLREIKTSPYSKFRFNQNQIAEKEKLQ